MGEVDWRVGGIQVVPPCGAGDTVTGHYLIVFHGRNISIIAHHSISNDSRNGSRNDSSNVTNNGHRNIS